jgi:hypothetical protein
MVASTSASRLTRGSLRRRSRAAQSRPSGPRSGRRGDGAGTRQASRGSKIQGSEVLRFPGNSRSGSVRWPESALLGLRWGPTPSACQRSLLTQCVWGPTPRRCSSRVRARCGSRLFAPLIIDNELLGSASVWSRAPSPEPRAPSPEPRTPSPARPAPNAEFTPAIAALPDSRGRPRGSRARAFRRALRRSGGTAQGRCPSPSAWS